MEPYIWEEYIRGSSSSSSSHDKWGEKEALILNFYDFYDFCLIEF
jgi:hypothetical protein